MKTIAITGGIGSGKSVVCKILNILGYSIYDCDTEAKRIMDCSSSIKAEIAQKICREAIDGEGNIDRAALAKVVFSSPKHLCTLNSIVHSHVKRDIQNRINASTDDILFIETAILVESGLDRMVDEVWIVDAPAEIRIERVMHRSNLSEQETKNRIAAQNNNLASCACENCHYIINDGDLAILPQILALIN